MKNMKGCLGDENVTYDVVCTFELPKGDTVPQVSFPLPILPYFT